MLLRIIAWLLLSGYLVVVGLWPPALTPISLALTGASLALDAIPLPVYAIAAAIAWWKRQPVPAPASAV